MDKIINLALQVLPLKAEREGIAIIDKAIECIDRSGLTYRVTPFETVIEGEYEGVMSLVREVHSVCFEQGAEELLVNIKIHSRRDGNVSIGEKMDKYDPAR
jgi:uncharacterized protein YqgV (UPF0045/DUF77 family)